MTGFDNVLPFPETEPAAAPATYVTNPLRLWWMGMKDRVRLAFGRLMERLGVPGAVQPFEIHDELTGQHIKVTVSPTFTVIQVNGRDYYFYRYTGRFDGTGMGCG